MMLFFRLILALSLSLRLALPFPLARAENLRPDPAPKPYSKCERLLMAATDNVRDVVQSFWPTINAWITPVKPWAISQEDAAAIGAIFADGDSSDEQNFEKALDRLTESRLKDVNPVSRFFIRRAARDAMVGQSLYARTAGGFLRRIFGPHYNPIFNRTATYAGKGRGATRLDTMIAVHENEHLIHRNTNPIYWIISIKLATFEMFTSIFRTPLTPATRRRKEVRALGAQWELVHLIPADIRERLYSEWQADDAFNSHREDVLVHAVIKSGVLDRAKTLVLKGLRLRAGAIEAGELYWGIESSMIGALIGRGDFGKWFKILKKRANGALSAEEIAYLAGIQKEGVDYAPIRAELEAYLDSHSDSEVLDDTGIAPMRLDQAKKMLSQMRYPDAIGAMLDQIYGMSLRYADLEKDEFIRRMSPVHNYELEDMIQAHYAHPFRRILLFGTVLIVLFAAAQNFDPLTFIPAADLRLISDLLK